MSDVEYFCTEVLAQSKAVDNLKYIIENSKNIIVIFDTSSDQEIVEKEMSELLDNENVLFYFMFKKQDILLSYIPESMRGLIFKPNSEILKFQVEQVLQNDNLNLDDILEKIEKEGIDSLTSDEKKFLDNFEN